MAHQPENDEYWNLGGPKIYSEADIDSAVAAGVLSGEDARRLRRHVLAAKAPLSADEEYFRLVGGFNDIFVTIACALLLAATGWLLRNIYPAHPAIFPGGVAFLAWALAEYFVRKKRLALTAIILLFVFAGGVFFGVLFSFPDSPQDPQHLVEGAAIATAVAAGLHWRRFHVPVAVASGVAAVLCLVIAGILRIIPEAKLFLAPIFFGAGVMVLALALYWDSLDVARQTRHSDIAFWLHLLAAPLLVHPVFQAIGIFEGKASFEQALAVVGIYGVLGFISLIVDRRALMVSSLGYTVYALNVVFREYGVVEQGVATAALVVGSSLLLLAAFWQPARARAVKRLPKRLQARFPPVDRA
ncbi:hypothetical protein FACS1894205_2650 [Alphaproteobacteria bacterium]|nr:hypothetical protein FACS1894205_2650 [Alphaproteobacteria bacterium]